MKRYRAEIFLLVGGIIVIALFYLSEVEALEQKGLSQLVTVGVPLDDVYIHCRYAQNLLAGNGYCFNPGPIVTADTSPLWVVLIALGGLFTSHLEIVAVLLSALFYLLLIIAVYRFLLRLGIEQSWSVVAAVLVLISGRILWSALSGMEVTLASLITVLALDAHFRRKFVVSAMWLGIGISTRPELMLLAAILFADRFVMLFKRDEQIGRFLQSIIVFLVVVTPFFLLPLIERGSLVYHSSVVQGARLFSRLDLGYLWFAAKILFATVTPPFVVALIATYIFRGDRRYRLISIFAFGLPITLAIIAPQYRHHGRYFFPVIPLLIVLGIAALGCLLRNKRSLWAYVTLFLLMFHASVVALRWNDIVAYSATNIAGQHVAVADWVEKHVARDEVIAAHDVGALGYFTGRPVVDLVGLVSPELYPFQGDQRLVWHKAREMGATVFIIYDRLNPTFYQYAKDSLALQASLRVEPLVSSADTVMNIYRIRNAANRSQ